MQLTLTFDPAWRVLDAPESRRVAVGPDVVVTFGPLELASERSLLAVDLPPAAHLRVVRTEDRQTRDGWPLRLVDAEIVAFDATAAATPVDRTAPPFGGAAGRAQVPAVEARCYACFRFLAYTAVAVARAADLAAIEARRASLVATFEAGRPDWRDAPICLAEAYAFDGTALLDERELERFGGDGFEVVAFETLRPRDLACHPVLTFRAVRDGELLPVSVIVETSDPARAAGTPYVIAVAGDTYRVVATHAALPPYTELKRQLLPVLADAVRALSR
jgi:hypothetical protein